MIECQPELVLHEFHVTYSTRFLERLRRTCCGIRDSPQMPLWPTPWSSEAHGVLWAAQAWNQHYGIYLVWPWGWSDPAPGWDLERISLGLGVPCVWCSFGNADAAGAARNSRCNLPAIWIGHWIKAPCGSASLKRIRRLHHYCIDQSSLLGATNYHSFLPESCLLALFCWQHTASVFQLFRVANMGQVLTSALIHGQAMNTPLGWQRLEPGPQRVLGGTSQKRYSSHCLDAVHMMLECLASW